jgi:polyphosphate glucokinase
MSSPVEVTGFTPRGGVFLPASPPASILAIDIGGSKVKILVSGQTEPRKLPSGKTFTPARMVEAVRELTRDWEYEAVSIGMPAQVGGNGPRSEPGNLGPGWVGYDYAAAFGRPVRILNDAAMQALGSYEGGRMLFIGLGTGVGSALIAENVIVPLELGHLPYRDGPLWHTLGRRGLRQLGGRVWREAVNEVIPILMDAFLADYIVLGGGNAKKIKTPPTGARLSSNLTAFRGGFRLWHVEDAPTLVGNEQPPAPGTAPVEWRLL